LVSDTRFAGNFKVLFKAWNKGTNYWLRETFYKRMTQSGEKSGFLVAMGTFAISAFWHGFEPVYLLSE
jgi:lysophospholipid acyltransferase